jgi:hypothetical protein
MPKTSTINQTYGIYRSIVAALSERCQRITSFRLALAVRCAVLARTLTGRSFGRRKRNKVSFDRVSAM